MLGVATSRSVGEASEGDSESSGVPVAQWLEGYNFDWTQLTEGQQDAYHGMVGRYLQSQHDND